MNICPIINLWFLFDIIFHSKKDFKMEGGNCQRNHFKDFPRAEGHEFPDWKNSGRNQPDG